MNTAFKDAEWNLKQSPTTGNYFVYSKSGVMPIAGINNAYKTPDMGDPLANATLIAAAPELLQTCIEIRQMYEGRAESFEVKIIKDALDKVINKACNLIP